jgi:hypothetical protein
MLDFGQDTTALPADETVEFMNPQMECCNADNATVKDESHFIVNPDSPKNERCETGHESGREPGQIELIDNENAETDCTFSDEVKDVATAGMSTDAKSRDVEVLCHDADANTSIKSVLVHRMQSLFAASATSLAEKSSERTSHRGALATTCRGSSRKTAAVLLANALSPLRGRPANRTIFRGCQETDTGQSLLRAVNDFGLAPKDDPVPNAASCCRVSSVSTDSNESVPSRPRVSEPSDVSEVDKPSINTEIPTSGKRCQVCGRLFQRKWGVRRHEMRFRGKCKMLNEASSTIRHSCRACGRLFQSKYGVRRHEMRFRGNCKMPNNRFKQSDDTGSLPVKGRHHCQKCGGFFHSKYGVRRHEMRFRGNCKNSVLGAERWNFSGNSLVFVKHRCQLCGESFQRSYGLRRHQMRFHGFKGTHMKAIQEVTTSATASTAVEPEWSQFDSSPLTENKHCCQSCGKIYTRKWQLLRHAVLWRGDCVNHAARTADVDVSVREVSAVSDLETKMDGNDRHCSVYDTNENTANIERLPYARASKKSNQIDAASFQNMNRLQTFKNATNGGTIAEPNHAVVGRGYKCCMCNRVYSSKSSYNRHLIVRRRNRATEDHRDRQEVSPFDDVNPGTDVAVEDAENTNNKVLTSESIERTHATYTHGCKGLRGSLRRAGLLVGVYRCFECEEVTEFPTYELLIAHRRNCHRRSECYRCGLAFVGRLAFLEHARQVHPGIPVYKVSIAEIETRLEILLKCIMFVTFD